MFLGSNTLATSAPASGEMRSQSLAASPAALALIAEGTSTVASLNMGVSAHRQTGVGPRLRASAPLGGAAVSVASGPMRSVIL